MAEQLLRSKWQGSIPPQAQIDHLGEGRVGSVGSQAPRQRALRACETLARIRKLKLPTLQVNIGQKQLNVAGAQ